MHRNTFLFIVGLAVITALVLGVNIGKSVRKDEAKETILLSPTPTILVEPTEEASPSPTLKQTKEATVSSKLTPTPTKGAAGKKQFTHAACGVTFSYDASDTVQTATDGAMLVGENDDTAVIICQKDVPRPAVPSGSIEKKTISGVAANLYHTQSQKTGTPIDVLIFTHPKNGKDIFLSGTGALFEEAIKTLSIIQ